DRSSYHSPITHRSMTCPPPAVARIARARGRRADHFRFGRDVVRIAFAYTRVAPTARPSRRVPHGETRAPRRRGERCAPRRYPVMTAHGFITAPFQQRAARIPHPQAHPTRAPQYPP